MKDQTESRGIDLFFLAP